MFALLILTLVSLGAVAVLAILIGVEPPQPPTCP